MALKSHIKKGRAARRVAEATDREGLAAVADVEKVRSLLKAKTTDGPTVAFSLLESLGVTRGDCEAVFTDRVVSSIVRNKQMSPYSSRVIVGSRWNHSLLAGLFAA